MYEEQAHRTENEQAHGQAWRWRERGGKRCPRAKASLVPAHPRTATSMLKSQAQPSDLSSLFWSPGRANPHLSGFGYGDTWDPKIGALSLQTLMTFTSTHTPSPAPWPGQKLP